MIAVPQTFADMPRWWHDDAGRAWLQQLPEIVSQQCQYWSLEVDGTVRHGSNALVVPVARGGKRFALRLAPPGDDVSAEAAALTFWAGRGTVLLQDVDTEQRAVLLERLDDSRTLLTEPLDEAMAILGGLVRMLAVSVAVPADQGSVSHPELVAVEVPTTRSAAEGIARTAEAEWAQTGRPISSDELGRVLDHAADRASVPAGWNAVDGDLHCEQVLAGERAPWIVVDPVLMRGDPEYDLGNILWTRLDEMPGDEHVQAMFDIFVAASGVPAERARSWVAIRSMSYLIWGLKRGLTEDPPKCRRLIQLFA